MQRFCRKGMSKLFESYSYVLRQLQLISEHLNIPDLPSSHLRICCAHAHSQLPLWPGIHHGRRLIWWSHWSRQKRILHLSAKFSGPTVEALQMKVTAQVRRLITSGASQCTREWTNQKECHYQSHPVSYILTNLNRFQKQFIRRCNRDYRGGGWTC